MIFRGRSLHPEAASFAWSEPARTATAKDGATPCSITGDFAPVELARQRLPQVRSNDDNIAQASLRDWRQPACPADGRPVAVENDICRSDTRQGDHAMDSINVKARRLAPLDTPTDLRSDATKDIAAALTLLLTDFFALYLKTKNFHWHMSGPHFRDYHLLLDDQGDQIFAATDAIAERVRKIGGTTLRSIGQISRSQRLLDNDADYVTPHDMLAELREDNKQLVAFMRETHDLCDEGNDVASASLIENWIDEAEQRTWFLFEASRTSGSVGD
jgi:starvation-inducible DNA-binding protein